MNDAEIIAQIRSRLLREVFDTVLDELIAIANGTTQDEVSANVRATVGFNLLKMCLPVPGSEVTATGDQPRVVLGPDVDTVDDWLRLIKEQKLDKPKSATIVRLKN